VDHVSQSKPDFGLDLSHYLGESLQNHASCSISARQLSAFGVAAVTGVPHS